MLRRTVDSDIAWAAEVVHWFDRATPSPADWALRLRNEALCHGVVERPGAEARFLCYLVEPNWVGRTAFLLIHGPDQQLASPLAADAVATFCRWAFDVWPLRRIYLEWLDVIPPPTALYGSAEVEGRLLGHRWVHNEYRDVILFAITPASVAVRPSAGRGL
jgi:RimJ/RimL family protein N-acetyltransferase